MANLAQYQQAASSIYEPQLQGDITNATAAKDAQIANLESSKGQINTDYQTAIQNLNDTTKSNMAKIDQLYNERLSGNFSGLQANDAGGMLAKAQQAQSTIEQTRANKLNQIATNEANINNTYAANVSSLKSKYQGQEANYAQSAYASAVKAEQDNAYKQEQLNLSYARLAASQNRAPSASEVKQSDMSTIGSFLDNVKGGDGHVSQQNWNQAMSKWIQAGYDPSEFIKSYKQYVNGRYSGYHGVT